LIEQDAATIYVSSSSFLAATCESIGDGSKFDNVSPEEIRATIRKTFSTFCDEIANTGTLTVSGKEKSQSIARVNLDCDPTIVGTWRQIHYLLCALDELTDTDFIATPAPEQESTATFDSVLKVLPDTFDGRRDARLLCNEDYFLGEGKAVFDEWRGSILSNFHVTLDESEQRAAIDWFLKNNCSFLSRPSYDQCRLNLVARGILSEQCLTPEDRAALLVESSPAQTYTDRQELKRKLSLLNR
jgi:hypothetical protein